MRPSVQQGRRGESDPVPEDGLQPRLQPQPGEAHPGRHPPGALRQARPQPHPGNQRHPGMPGERTAAYCFLCHLE